MKLHWMTTHPSGKAHTHGADDGQTGWRLHLVDTEQSATLSHVTLRYMRALCGLKPGTDWGLDLFIDTPCKRCVKAAEKRGLDTPNLFR